MGGQRRTSLAGRSEPPDAAENSWISPETRRADHRRESGESLTVPATASQTIKRTKKRNCRTSLKDGTLGWIDVVVDRSG